MKMNVERLISIAKSWNRKSLRGIRGCPKETCAFFVRYVFREAFHQSGIMQVANYRPYYDKHHIPALPTNENFADGLAGDVIGRVVTENQIQPGDILLFRDTYSSPEFPRGSITHVGIALDDNGLMADSSSGMCYVRNYRTTFRERNNSGHTLLVEVRRPHCLDTPSNAMGVSLNRGQVHKSKVNQEIKVLYGGGYVGKLSNATGIKLRPVVEVDGVSVQYNYITVDITLAGNGQHIKLFHHDGKTNSIVGGHPSNQLNVIARMQNGLHIWVEGKEIKPASVNIGVS